MPLFQKYTTYVLHQEIFMLSIFLSTLNSARIILLTCHQIFQVTVPRATNIHFDVAFEARVLEAKVSWQQISPSWVQNQLSSKNISCNVSVSSIAKLNKKWVIFFSDSGSFGFRPAIYLYCVKCTLRNENFWYPFSRKIHFKNWSKNEIIAFCLQKTVI